MGRIKYVWLKIFVFSIIFIVSLAGCTATSIRLPPTAIQETRTYSNREYKFSLAYPPDWMIENESYQWLVLVPIAAQSWQPTRPSETSQDPHMMVEMDGYIREKRGYANFPAFIDANSLKTWLEQRVDAGEARQFAELTIHDTVAFAITEVDEAGCEKAVYWRPTEGIEGLIRISTGCESMYLQEFDRIVSTLRQLN